MAKFLAIVVAIMTACGSNLPIGHQTSPIINGAPPTDTLHPMYDAWKATVGLAFQQGQGWYFVCSGTLIAPDVVLTAAHCVEGQRGIAKKLAIITGDQVYGGTLLPVVEVRTHSGYKSASVHGWVNDIALLRLKNLITTIAPIPPLSPDFGLTAADAGQPINMAGFGRTETGEVGVKYQRDDTLGGITNPCVFLDENSNIQTAACLSDETSQLWYAQHDGGPCSGDSGGPAFILRDAVYVAGVTSYGDSNCALYGVSTRTDVYDCWIRNFINPGSCGCVAEVCGDGIDNDCDGEVDEDCACTLKPDGARCKRDTQCCSGYCQLDGHVGYCG